MACDARQYGDEMMCGRCGRTWEVNDPDPPACAKKFDRRAIPDRRVTTAVKRVEGSALVEPYPLAWQANGRSAWIPEELPDDLAEQMISAFHLVPGEGVDAMREAYKVFLARVGQR